MILKTYHLKTFHFCQPVKASLKKQQSSDPVDIIFVKANTITLMIMSKIMKELQLDQYG